jgi:hypothetical protein
MCGTVVWKASEGLVMTASGDAVMYGDALALIAVIHHLLRRTSLQRLTDRSAAGTSAPVLRGPSGPVRVADAIKPLQEIN